MASEHPVARAGYPSRVVCLTEETTEILYRLGAGDLVVGVSGFTVRPPAARRKPKVSTYLEADYDKILGLRPELVFAFSDLQADITRELVRRGVSVVTFNQRSVAEILQVVRMVGGLIGRHDAGERLAGELAGHLDEVRTRAAALPRRPRVFFEEWPDPLIAGIRWVSELIEIAGGDDVCASLRAEQGAKGRIVEPAEIARRDPEVLFSSWCGKKVRFETIRTRPSFAATSAVRAGRLHEVKSSLILQPGPAALTEGLDALHAHIAAAARQLAKRTA